VFPEILVTPEFEFQDHKSILEMKQIDQRYQPRVGGVSQPILPKYPEVGLHGNLISCDFLFM